MKTPEGGRRALAGRARDRSLVQLIETGALLPIICGEAFEDMVLNGHDALVSRYADSIEYPLQDRTELHKMAKYRALKEQYKASDLKWEYLDVVAEHLAELARQQGTPARKIEEARSQGDRTTVSKFAELLGFPRFGDGGASPLEILANLPLPIFITTSPFKFLEQALARAGKEPQTEFLRWRQELDGNPPSIFGPKAPLYEPTADRPLVFHLYGLDEYEVSLVLTEDDYLDFLMAVSQVQGKDVDPVPTVVKRALQSKALMLMGFSLSSWAFRVLYRGLIKPMPPTDLYRRYCCLQLVPNEDEKSYYEIYLRDEARFDKIYWKNIDVFCQEDLPGAG